jgi:methylthioribose-1-phosphate isomerase
MNLISRVQAVAWRDEACVLLDQTKLPSETTFLSCTGYRQVVDAIRRLAVRGAPAIGIAGAYAVVLAAREVGALTSATERTIAFKKALFEIRDARPTAVNLSWAVSKMETLTLGTDPKDLSLARLTQEAHALHEADLEGNRTMAELGAALLPQNKPVITYCNTGDLATGGIGTAFGVLHQGYRDKKVSHVYTCETRPVLQGLRLTTWELQQNEIPFTAICDNMAALILRDRNVGAVILGADRIAGNGDAANKVGSYALAVLAKHHGVPFYVVAPVSTFDTSLGSGSEIPIETRASSEIVGILGNNQHAKAIEVWNPSFDVTPHELITAIICEKGVIHRPTTTRVKAILDNPSLH